jgi:hypothetical protein
VLVADLDTTSSATGARKPPVFVLICATNLRLMRFLRDNSFIESVGYIGNNILD